MPFRRELVQKEGSKMMKKILLLFLALCLAASALGCRREVPDRLLTLSGGGETTAAAGESAPPQSSQGAPDSTDGDPTKGTGQNQAGTMAFSVTPETDPTLLSGRLEYTVTGVRIVENVSDLPNPAGFGNEAVPLYNETGAEQIYKYQSDRYPSFLLSDGGFVPALTVVLVDVTVESFDAVARTKKDTDSHGRGGGQYDDPYLFQADALLTVVDRGRRQLNTEPMEGWNFDWGIAKDQGIYQEWHLGYFSAPGESPDATFCYRLEPGQKRSFTLGFLVTNRSDGTPRDLSGLCARIGGALLSEEEYTPGQTYLVDLGLEGEK